MASATRLHFPDPGAAPAEIEAFGRRLARLGDLAVNKPTLQVPHTGGRRLQSNSAEARTLAAWIRHAATLPEIAAPAPPPAVPALALRRLTHSQYNHTVRDLLGDESRPADQFPPEDFVNGYKGHAQSISPMLAEAYSRAAEKLARSFFRGRELPRDGAGFIGQFGRRAFRRPVTPAESARYLKLWTAGGPQLVVEAMLQSPAFLFYDGPAARLSYFLWDSMPDDEVLGARLDTPAALERQARRMLDHPNARRAVDEFVSQWLRFDRVVNNVKDRRQFPMYTPELALAMTEETRRLIAELVWNDRNFLDLFTAPYSFLTSDLAAVYNLPAPAEEFARVSFPPETDRAGILGQAAFLALTSKPAETSPTARGLFIREQFLCQHVPDPPPGVSSNLPPFTPEKPVTNRERLAIHLSNESCASCHNLIDPIGFGLEKYDAIGRRQEKLKITFYPDRASRDQAAAKSVELELDTRGHIAGIPKSEFSNPRELGRVLAASPQCHECVVKQVFRYASGRMETPADRPVIERALADFRDSQFRFKSLIIALAKWREFPSANP